MYYPKSQIKTNLYTNGEEYILSTTEQEYIGYYHETSNGKKYTGKVPTPLSIELIKILPQSDEPGGGLSLFILTLSNFEDYPNQSLQDRFLPQFNPTTPTTKDYTLGSFTRYFCKKTNELKYIEINKETHDKLKVRDKQIAWDLYEPQSIVWQINGDREGTFLANKNNIALLEKRQNWYGFSQYLKEDYLKYYLAS